MGHAAYLFRLSFGRIFANMAKEVDADIKDVQIVICYPKGTPQYDIYKSMKKEKEDVELDNFSGSIINWTGSGEVVKMTIATAGIKYAKELDVPIYQIKIVMRHREGKLPEAVLLSGEDKIRAIDIEKEFLS